MGDWRLNYQCLMENRGLFYLAVLMIRLDISFQNLVYCFPLNIR